MASRCQVVLAVHWQPEPASEPLGRLQAVLNQGDQGLGENLIPPSPILIPDIPDILEVPWVPSGAWLPDIRVRVITLTSGPGQTR
jgi:hypothetical protein